MSSFPSPLSSPQLATARASGYWARILACLNPNAVVFQAQAAEDITGTPFTQFTYNNVTIGAYTDVWPGMLLYLSPTTDIRDAYFRGRVRLDPTSSILYVNQNPSVLTTGDYVLIVRDVDLFARVRNDTLVDSSITFQRLQPTTMGLPSAIVLYDSDNDGQVSYTTIQTGIAVDADATTVDIWNWDVSGDGASSIDDPTLQNPTFTFEAGYHYLIRAQFEDDDGNENYQISHVYAVDRTFSAPAVTHVIAGSVQLDGDDGNTASLTAYAQVSTLLDRTHCAVWSIEHFGDDSDTPFVSNVLMNGRIRSDSIQTEGSAEAGRLQQVTFQVEGITAYLRRLRIPNDIIRPDATPSQWGEIENPTPWRMVVYALWVYTTLTNICSVSVEDGAFEAWQIGAEPRGIDGGYALDVINSILETIHAAPNWSPSGEIHLAQTVSYKADRSGVPLIMTFGLGDQREYTIDRDSSKTVAQTVAFGGVFNSDANTIVLYTAQAPSIVYGDGAEIRELTREILTVDSTAADAAEEIGLRASNDYAFNNPKALLRQGLYDSFAGVLIPTNFQRWSNVIPASSNPLAIAYGATDYFQLQSASLTINANGSIDPSGEWYEETSFDDAQVLAALLPNNLSNMNPSFPVLPNDPAFPTDPLENYPTDTPSLDELAPIDPDSAAQAYTPFPPDVAADVGSAVGNPGCKTLRVNFKSSTNTESSWITTLSDDYLMTVQGFASVGTGALVPTVEYRFDEGDDLDFIAYVNAFSVSYATYMSDGWAQGFPGRIIIRRDLSGGDTITGATLYLNRALTPADGAVANFIMDWGVNPAAPSYITSALTTFTDTYVFTGFSTTAGIGFEIGTNNSIPDVRLIRAVLTGALIPATDRYADAFYSWTLDADGNETDIQLLASDEGLFIDNTRYASIPPYSPDHRYTLLPFTGTGNSFLARMQFGTYSNNQNVLLFIEVCPKS